MVRGLVIGALCLVAAGGCVVSVANQTPKVGYSQIVPREPRPSVSYTVRCLSGKDQREFMSIAGLFPERLEPVLSKSKVFSRFTLGDASDDFQLVFVFHINPDMNSDQTGAVLYGVASGLTMGALPLSGKDLFILSVGVKRGGQLLKTYQYQESVSFFAWSALGIASVALGLPNAEKDAVDNMIRHFLRDAMEDNIFATSRAPP